MPALDPRLRVLVEPFAAAVFFVLWIVAEAGRAHDVGDLVVLTLIALAIGVSRFSPAMALGTFAGVVLLQLIEVLPRLESTTWPVYLGGLLVVGVVAARAPSVLGWVTLGLGVPVSAAVAFLMVIPSPADPWGWTSWTGQGGPTLQNLGPAYVTVVSTALALYAAAWAVGRVAGLSARQILGKLALQRAEGELLAAEAEIEHARDRNRLALDVHDVVAHALSVVIAQADGGRFLGATDARAMARALEEIASAARDALIDVQLLVERIREDTGERPQPRLEDIRALLDRVRAAGLDVHDEELGERQPLSASQQLAVFRIVQECCTNALKYAARTGPTRISFDWNGPGLALSVLSPLPEKPEQAEEEPEPEPAPKPRDRGAAHGIPGMKERARLAGGWLQAGVAEEGEALFVVTAFIPTRGAEAAA